MRQILAFIWRYNFFFLFLVLEVFSIILLVNKSYYQRAVITNFTDGFTGSVYDTYSSFTGYFHLKKENERLAMENAMLWQRLKDGQLTTDTTSIQLTDTLNRQTYRYTVAKVISNSTNNRNNYIMLNKGKKHGITPDMAVINPQGIVGTVVSVSDNFCWVMSALNKHSKISGRINRLNQMGTIVWQGTNPRIGSLTDIPVHVKVHKGDSIYTSGFSYIFPEGIMVGRVDKIDVREGEHFYDIEFIWSADFNSLTYVYIVKNLLREEQVDLSKDVIDE
ncbi:MAG: rod shape-determining protein MreC [Chloroflexota bacterium]|nr:rod shape-determining protein MreC [Lentimicrobium sp.]